MHIGILTGGGDCPGLNAVIRAVTLALQRECGARVTGIERGFRGLLERRSRGLGPAEVIGIVEIDGRVIGDGKPGPVTKQLRDKFFRYAHGKEK